MYAPRKFGNIILRLGGNWNDVEREHIKVLEAKAVYTWFWNASYSGREVNKSTRSVQNVNDDLIKPLEDRCDQNILDVAKGGVYQLIPATFSRAGQIHGAMK